MINLKRKLKLRGFREISTRGRCKYYVKEGERYAVAFPVHRRKEYAVIVEKDVFERLSYPSIFMDKKNDKMLVPSIQRGVNRHKGIHRIVFPAQDGMVVDHINHDRCCCIKSNLRRCEHSENQMNSLKKVRIETENGGYCFRLTGLSHERGAIPELKNRDFRMISDVGTQFTIASPIFQSRVDCCLEYRDSAKILYKGTKEKHFVYDLENDFEGNTDLLIRHHIFRDITGDEMKKMNLQRWRDKLD